MERMPHEAPTRIGTADSWGQLSLCSSLVGVWEGRGHRPSPTVTPPLTALSSPWSAGLPEQHSRKPRPNHQTCTPVPSTPTHSPDVCFLRLQSTHSVLEVTIGARAFWEMYR